MESSSTMGHDHSLSVTHWTASSAVCKRSEQSRLTDSPQLL